MSRWFWRACASLLSLLMASGAFAQEECMQQVVITGYRDVSIPVVITYAIEFAPTPIPGSGPGGAYSANPNVHVNCSSTFMGNEQHNGSRSTPSQPNNNALPIPMRYANPIDISNNSPVGKANGGTNGPAGFMVFPNYAQGVNAAIQSVQSYAQSGASITALINAWAPPSANPNTMGSVLSSLGITSTMASSTKLSSLTTTQVLQIIGAFAWQEGFKPAGC